MIDYNVTRDSSRCNDASKRGSLYIEIRENGRTGEMDASVNNIVYAYERERERERESYNSL